MGDKFKIVCCTPAGRRRYMQYLIPFVVSSNIVDRYDIWINTVDKQDIEFFRIMSEKFPVINPVYQPDGIVNGVRSINAFFRTCTEEDAIYFRLDDDIVWMEPDAIEKMVRFRIDNPQYFIVAPLVINNALSTYILQNANKIKLSKYCMANSAGKDLWKSGTFAAQLHEWFLSVQLPNERYKNLYCGAYPIAMNRFSINSIIWFGGEMKKFDGVVLGDEEEYMSVIKPAELKAANCINGDAIISHFAFYPQRKKLDKLNILDSYGKYLHEKWKKDPVLHNIDNIVQDAMKEVEEKKATILAKPDVYSTLPFKKRLKNKVAKWEVPIPKLYTLGQAKNLLPMNRLKISDK